MVLANWVADRVVEDLELMDYHLCCHRPKEMHKVKGVAHFVSRWAQQHCLRHEPCLEEDGAAQDLVAVAVGLAASHEACLDDMDIQVGDRADSHLAAGSTVVAEHDSWGDWPASSCAPSQSRPRDLFAKGIPCPLCRPS